MFPIYDIYELAESLVNLSDKNKESLQLHLNTQYGLHILLTKITNEEELDRIADELNPNNPHGDTYETGQYFGLQDGFEAGYHKAMGEKV